MTPASILPPSHPAEHNTGFGCANAHSHAPIRHPRDEPGPPNPPPALPLASLSCKTYHRRHAHLPSTSPRETPVRRGVLTTAQPTKGSPRSQPPPPTASPHDLEKSTVSPAPKSTIRERRPATTPHRTSPHHPTSIPAIRRSRSPDAPERVWRGGTVIERKERGNGGQGGRGARENNEWRREGGEQRSGRRGSERGWKYTKDEGREIGATRAGARRRRGIRGTVGWEGGMEGWMEDREGRMEGRKGGGGRKYEGVSCVRRWPWTRREDSAKWGRAKMTAHEERSARDHVGGWGFATIDSTPTATQPQRRYNPDPKAATTLESSRASGGKGPEQAKRGGLRGGRGIRRRRRRWRRGQEEQGGCKGRDGVWDKVNGRITNPLGVERLPSRAPRQAEAQGTNSGRGEWAAR
ncbi:hypothetical protein FA13DRAFT_1715116, partial [Coprinellus micaceus]